ncbi:STAS/SEC14 domain-containing protein [Arthrobacter sp. C9C5]|uniref:DUF7793 family protein n=1 Tax=Arthrobacter sp. C9C5 TaxID=2735267 RepID=UPI00201C7376|nr:STAS/SEC14 domain-containing protein [Arthrobacter sp. C9C5]
MMPEPIRAANGKNSLRISDGIIESVWAPGSFVDVGDARDAMRATELISQGRQMPMLSVMTDVEISAAARYEFAKSVDVLAIAVLGSSAVDRVVAAATSRDTKYPHEFFTSRPDAVAWLSGFIESPAELEPDDLEASVPTPRSR